MAHQSNADRGRGVIPGHIGASWWKHRRE